MRGSKDGRNKSMLELVLENSTHTPENSNNNNYNRYVHGFNSKAFLDSVSREEHGVASGSVSRKTSRVNVLDEQRSN